MLTIRQLRYFSTLSETLHFGQAAKRLNISQPALSAQIAQMEEFFGGPLFQRASSGVTLTSDGTLIGARVRRILAEMQEDKWLSGKIRGDHPELAESIKALQKNVQAIKAQAEEIPGK